MRLARALLFLLALLGAQYATLHHDLEHAAHELNVAGLDHGTEKCVAYDALGHALHGSIAFLAGSFIPLERNVSFEFFPGIPARVAFDSRAPPYSA